MRSILPIAALAWALSATAPLLAQSSNPLEAPIPPNRYGAEFGLNVNQQSGSFTGDCGCVFDKGSGMSIFGSFIAETHLSQRFAFMGRASMSTIHTTSSNTVTSMWTYKSTQTGAIDSASVATNQEASTVLAYIVVAPMARFDITRKLFIAAGPAIGLALSSSLNADETIITNGYVYSDGGGTTRSIQKGSVPGLTGIRFSMYAQLGYELDITPKWTFIPTAAIDLPLTTVGSGNAWKIMSLQILGGLRWKLHM